MRTSPKPFCFVLMPFSSEFDDTYRQGIKEACEEAGAYCERVDEQVFHERILDRIYNQINTADYIIAEMTSRNANVFYEVGYAHALNKPVILLIEKSTEIPFDLKHHPHIIYNGSIPTLKSQLISKLKSFIENDINTMQQVTRSFELYLLNNQLQEKGVVIDWDKHGTLINLNLVVRNLSPSLMSFSDYKIAIRTSKKFDNLSMSCYTSEIQLPEGNWVYYLRELDTIFPEGVSSLAIYLELHDTSDIVFDLIIYFELGRVIFPVKINIYH